MTTTYLMVTAIVFLFLAIIWNKDSLVNVIIKLGLWIMFIWTGLVLAVERGYIKHY